MAQLARQTTSLSFKCPPSRLRHVDIHQTVRPVPEREGLRLPSDGFRFHQSEERVSGRSGAPTDGSSPDCLLLNRAP